jgi:proteic killer suppression protein
MNLQGLRLHVLKGRLKGAWAGNWRVVFRFEGKDAVEVDYGDYH